MNIKRIWATALIMTVGSFLSGVSLADIDAALKMCVNCHGEDGIGSQSNVPIIAGIPAVVQEDALFAYLDGDRNCGTAPLMCNIVSRLTEDQVVELAEFYAAKPYKPAGEEFDPMLAEKGNALHRSNCIICHGDDPADAESSILYGQRMDYLRYSLSQYVTGERKQLPAMQRKMSMLSADDIEALLNYYASYRE